MVSFPLSRSQMCYSVVNNYLSAGGNRFDLESGPWTIRATCGKETLYLSLSLLVRLRIRAAVAFTSQVPISLPTED